MPEDSNSHSQSKRRIDTRLVLTFTSLLAGAMVIASSALLTLRVGDLQKRMIADIHVRAETIATQIAPSLDFEEPTEATTILSHLINDPSIRAAEITHVNGTPFAAFGTIAEAMTPSTTRTFVTSAGPVAVCTVAFAIKQVDSTENDGARDSSVSNG